MSMFFVKHNVSVKRAVGRHSHRRVHGNSLRDFIEDFKDIDIVNYVL